MAAAVRRRPPALTLERLLSWVLPALFLVAVTLQGARTFYFLPFNVVRFSLSVELAVIGFYLVMAIYRVHLGVVAGAVALTAYVLAEHLWFSNLARAAPDYNAMASYLPLLSFVVFCEARASFNDLLRILLAVAVGYVLIYVFGHGLLSSLNAGTGAILPGSAGRASRLFLLATWATFVAFYGLTVRTLPTAARAALVLLGVAALWLSGSRTMQALFAVIFAAGALGFTGARTRTALFAGVVALTFLTLGGLVVEDWNPYNLMSWDASARYRAAAYPRVVSGIEQYPLFGVGLPASAETLSQFLRIPRDEILFPSDLGTAGMTFMFGFPGLLLCLAVVSFVFFSPAGDASTGRPTAALALNAMLGAAITWMSPMLLVEPSTVFLSLLLSLWIRRYRQRRSGYQNSPVSAPLQS